MSVLNDRSEAEAACWTRLAAHRFSDPAHRLSFTERLARENAWSLPYAGQVVEEYRKFCLLAVHAGHAVTPSDAVDQAWHLHLTYSRNYWDEFCPSVLEHPLHHGPTVGGTAEDKKFRGWYAETLHSYEKRFGPARADIWPEPGIRFRDADRFVRINRAACFLVDQAVLTLGMSATGGIAFIAGLVAMAARNGLALGISLSFLVMLGVLVFAAASLSPKAPPPQQKAPLPGVEAAVAVAGPVAAVEGAVEVAEVTLPPPQHPLSTVSPRST